MHIYDTHVYTTTAATTTTTATTQVDIPRLQKVETSQDA